MSVHNDLQSVTTKGGMKASFNTPVLFLIFCRPETTRQVFAAIRQARPTRLYVAADGPRTNSPTEKERCALSRQIATDVDWECEVHTLFRDENLGCGKGPSTAITWFFEHESEGIILEDDCIPSLSFFPYCAEVLKCYRHDTRIMHVAGTNLQHPALRDKEHSYAFSNFTYCWGWATWRRAWKLHDFDMSLYEEINKKDYLEGHYSSIYERDYFRYVFDRIHRGDRRHIWDYQWQFACRINSGLAIVPAQNLIVNVGLGEHGTNTIHANGIGHDLQGEEIDCPLTHPSFVMVNRKREKEIFRRNLTSQKSRIKSTLKRIVPGGVMEGLRMAVNFLLPDKVKSVQHDGGF